MCVRDMKGKKSESEERKEDSRGLRVVEEIANSSQPVDVKLSQLLDLMQSLLECEGSHQFGLFWSARTTCIALFKQSLAPMVRVHLWARYSMLCREAKQLKEVLDEQGAFVLEQIDKAIADIEHELDILPQLLAAVPLLSEISSCHVVSAHASRYQTLHKQLHYLNAFCSRISGLRKEVKKAEIRMRFKSRLFHRLHLLGDRVYPQRKELIQQMSELFLSDVELFIQSTFVGELKTYELFEVKEKIKQLQALSKIFTLNTEVFSKVRVQLSQCWDSVQGVVIERKKMQHEQRQHSHACRDELLHDLEQIEKEAEAISLSEARERIKAVKTKFSSVSMLSQDVHIIKKRLQLLEKECVAERGVPQKGTRGSLLQDRLSHCLEIEDRNEQYEAFVELVHEIHTISLTMAEAREIDMLLSDIRDLLEKKYTAYVCTIPHHDTALISAEIDRLELVRSEVKDQLEIWRHKEHSGLDFTQAMHYVELVDKEKARLRRIEGLLEELHEQASDEV